MTCEDFFKKICISHFIVSVRKGLLRVLLWEGVGDQTKLQYIDPYSYGVVSFSLSGAAQPQARGLSFLLIAGFLYHILSPTGLQNYWGSWGPLRPGVAFPTTSYKQLIWTPTLKGSPEGPFGLVWISLPLLVSNSNCLTSCLDRVI